jgi:hypothetical protein
MTAGQARLWIIKASLLLTSMTFAFFALTPIFGYPLTFEQSLVQLQIVLPVFVGYLASAAVFVFALSRRENTAADEDKLRPGASLLIRGPIFLYGFAFLIVTIAFGYSNRIGSNDGQGMSVDTLSSFLAVCLSVLTATTGSAVAYLFGVEESK